MRTFRVKLHSMTDLITNSSTTIYTFSNESPKAFEEMIDEFFKTFGIQHKCSDIFTVMVMPEYGDCYVEYLLDNFGLDEDDDEEDEPALYDEEDDYDKEEELDECDIPRKFRHPNTCSDALDQLIDDISSGKVERPGWFKTLEEIFLDPDSYSGGTTLVLGVKDPKYEALAERIVSFLYSTKAVESSC